MGDNIRGTAFVGVGGALGWKHIYIKLVDVQFAGSNTRLIKCQPQAAKSYGLQQSELQKAGHKFDD